MSNSVRPHRQQPTRLLCLWDSPRKNTGVGCHFLPQCMKVKSKSEVVQRARLLATPWTAAYQAPPSMGFSRQEYWNGVPWTLDSLMWGQEHSQLFLIHCFPVVCEKVTGRKARGLQMEEIACKCQTFLSLLSGKRKQTGDIFFLCTNLKGGFS